MHRNYKIKKRTFRKDILKLRYYEKKKLVAENPTLKKIKKTSGLRFSLMCTI